MVKKTKTNVEFLNELQELRSRLEESEETLRAIRSGEVDALVVSTPEGEKVFTLKGVDEIYRTFVETMAEGGATLTAAGTILYCNSSFAEILGTTSEKIIGSSIYRYIAAENREPLASLIQTGLKESAKQELPLQAVDGSSVPVFLALHSIPDANIPDTLCLVVTNLTELKTVQEHATRLEAVTRQLEASNRELETFSYSISHDLRQPLRAIESHARIALRDLQGKREEEAKSKIEAIRERAKKMDQLIENILTFFRLGHQEVTVAIIDAEKLIAEVWNELRQSDAQRRAELNISSLPFACQGDENMIRQVFTNLLSNALKFTKDREQAIIAIGGEEKTNECVYYVKDNGVGFDMQSADKLFKLFQRLHSEEEFEGTGVGLSFVKRIIEHHDGRVWAEGKVNEGATFYFSLPKQ